MPEFKGSLRTPRLPSAPVSPITGEMYYDTTTNVLYWWNGTTWLGATGSQGPQGATGPAGPTGPPGAGIPTPVVNGQWIKGSGGAAVWSAISMADLPANVGQTLSGTYLLRPAANTVRAGSTYFATDTFGTWLSDGTNWSLIEQRAPMVTAGAMTVAPFTTPYDGQELVMVDSLTLPSYTWHLRYNANSTSTYKWECIGGGSYVGYSSANQQVVTVNTWTNIVASTIIPPRAGEYILQASCQTSHPSAGATSIIMLWAGSVPGGMFGPTATVGFPVAGGYSLVPSIGPFKYPLVAGNGVGIAAQNNVINGNFSLMQWSILPLRV
jgi:hypothetical protein